MSNLTATRSYEMLALAILSGSSPTGLAAVLASDDQRTKGNRSGVLDAKHCEPRQLEWLRAKALR
jgi:hypothetical protein